MAKTPEEIGAAMVAGLKEKTGKSIDEWVKIVKGSKLGKHGQIVAFLKAEHGIGHGYANLITHTALSGAPGEADGNDLVQAQYAGAKAGLRPIYDALIKMIEGLGKDVEVSPKKTYVSLRRSKQFALIQPTTATRIDLGIKLKDTPPAGRLEAAGSFNAMVTHRVKITDKSEINAELKAWLRRAYESA